VFSKQAVLFDDHKHVYTCSLTSVFSMPIAQINATFGLALMQIENDFKVQSHEFARKVDSGYVVHPVLMLALCAAVREDLFELWLDRVVVDVSGFISAKHFEYISPPFLFNAIYSENCMKPSFGIHKGFKTLHARKAAMTHKLNKLNYKKMMKKNQAFAAHAKNVMQVIPDKNEDFVAFPRADGSLTTNQLDADIVGINDERHPRYSEGCSICLDAPSEVVLQPCGHKQVCKECAAGLETCMVCRATIERKEPLTKSVQPFVPQKKLKKKKKKRKVKCH
jgi:hypothetical protein